jgi:two-component system, cell cycle response regulator
MNDPARKYEILVVDDSPVYRKLIEQILSGGVYSLSFACGGSEALKAYHQNSPDIVITDWIMPDLSGLELCRHIRADKTSAYTYVILMTSNTEKDGVVKGLEAGADDYLVKAFDSNEMVARIGVGRRIIDLHRQLERESAELEEAARTDSLTGLPNRRAIEEWTSKQLKGASRHGFPLWVVLGDLDSFKEINDSFGHEAGDIVLRTFADILKKGTRDSDFVLCAVSLRHEIARLYCPPAPPHTPVVRVERNVALRGIAWRLKKRRNCLKFRQVRSKKYR